eukprot:TRINITY_DN25023_c1_g1_i1.p1 TRINITY_DN25023_c1_g1~~TRINITY_DN25023_c1_g1_i1.p1  ORF type:complete len:695 (-),score=127.27 TRINITY_DN25023_c1_g1_i1:77-2161(-)
MVRRRRNAAAAATVTLVAVSCSIAIGAHALSDKPTAASKCQLSTLSVGERVLRSAKDLTRFVKKHKHVLVGFSAQSCSVCCTYEPIYNATLPQLPKGVRFVRVDMDSSAAKGLATTHDIDELPAVLFFRERRAVRLLEVQRPSTLRAFAERSVVPLPRIRGATLDAWLDLQRPFPLLGNASHDLRARHWAQVTALSVDGTEDEEELEELHDASDLLASRPLSFSFARVEGRSDTQRLLSHSLTSACGHAQATASSSSRAPPKRRMLMVWSLFDGEFVEPARLGAPGTSAPAASFAIAVQPGETQGGGLLLNVSRHFGIFDGDDTVNQPDAESVGGYDEASTGPTLTVAPRVACRNQDAYDGLSIRQWILLSLLPSVTPFTTSTSSLLESTQKPMFMLFADLNHRDLRTWLALMHDASKQYNDPSRDPRLLFTYVDGMKYSHHMRSLGLAGDPKLLPAIAFNDVGGRDLTWQPTAREYKQGSARITRALIDSLVQQYLRGETEEHVEDAAPEVKPVPKRDFAKGERRVVPNLDSLSLEQRLRFVTALNQETFAQVVFDSAKDVVVYFYTSEGAGSKTSKDLAIYYNRCAERFRELDIKTVEIARIDLAQFSAPREVVISKVPSVLLFPAFSKTAPFPIFDGKMKPQYIMRWIQEHASRRFSLPEVPHLDPLEAKLYTDQLSKSKAERASRSKSEL